MTNREDAIQDRLEYLRGSIELASSWAETDEMLNTVQTATLGVLGIIALEIAHANDLREAYQAEAQFVPAEVRSPEDPL